MIPTHGIYCYTKTFPTTCPSCNQPVFFFFCNCGSKVYFDNLGSPWPIHFCRKQAIVEAIELFRGSEYLTDIEIRKRIMDYAKNQDFEIDELAIETIEEELGKHNNKLIIYDAKLLKEEEDISGSVVHIDKNINIHKVFGVQKGSILEKALLGELFGKKMIEFKIREKPDKKNQCKQYVVYVDEVYLKAKPIKINEFILGVARKISNGMQSIYIIKEHLIVK